MRKIKYDFKVKDGWSKFKINLRSSSEGGECIIFEKMTGSNFLQGEFCDHQKQERFSEAEATHLIKSRLTFGNLTSVSTQNASVPSDDEIRQIFTPKNFYPNIKEDVAEAIYFLLKKDIKLETIGNNDFLIKGDNINKIDILFKKIDKNND